MKRITVILALALGGCNGDTGPLDEAIGAFTGYMNWSGEASAITAWATSVAFEVDRDCMHTQTVHTQRADADAPSKGPVTRGSLSDLDPDSIITGTSRSVPYVGATLIEGRDFWTRTLTIPATSPRYEKTSEWIASGEGTGSCSRDACEATDVVTVPDVRFFLINETATSDPEAAATALRDLIALCPGN
jgi:hypothetical protein